MGNEIRTCDHCNAKEGHRRPVGRYIVKLRSFEAENQKLELCMTCYKYFNRKKMKANSEAREKGPSLYSNVLKFYRERLHLVHKD